MVNKKNKNLLFLTAVVSAIVFVLPLLSFDSILAAEIKTCTTTECSAGMGEPLRLKVIPRDEDGNVIVDAPISYTWSVPVAALGTLAVETVNPNSLGYSQALLQVSPTASTGTVVVTAIYGGVSITTTFNISAACLKDPILYYGIAEVKDSGAANRNWQKSTAEVLETCRDEYRLYYPSGREY